MTGTLWIPNTPKRAFQVAVRGQRLPGEDNEPHQLFLACLSEVGRAVSEAEISHEFQNSFISQDFVAHVSI